MNIINQETALVAVDAIVEHPQNPNVGDLDLIGESLEENGFYGSLIVQRSTGYVLVGNHRLRAAKRLGLAEVPVTYVDVDDERAAKIMIADNKIAKAGDMDDAILAKLFEEIDALGTGFTDDEVSRLLENGPEDDDNGAEEADDGEGGPEDAADAEGSKDDKEEAKEREEREDPVAAAQERWRVEPGQLWRIGPHRLLCGDSTKVEDVARLFGTDKPKALVTDPPFAITGSATGSDDMSGLSIITPFFRAWMKAFADLLPTFAHVYVCCDWRTYGVIDQEAKAAGMVPKNCIIWHKGDGGLGAFHQNTHEFVWFGVREERKRIKANATGHRLIHGQPNLWRYNPPTYGKESWHTANKPVDMIQRMIENSTDPGDLVAEPFSGGGTTFVAAHRSGRVCYGLELEPKYVAVALERLEREGLTPVLEPSVDGHL